MGEGAIYTGRIAMARILKKFARLPGNRVDTSVVVRRASLTIHCPGSQNERTLAMGGVSGR